MNQYVAPLFHDGPAGNTPLTAAVENAMAQGIQNEDVTNPASPAAAYIANEFQTPAQASALYGHDVRAWAPFTPYVAGQAVVSPTGDVVTAKTNHTSGATYSGTGASGNWNLSGSYPQSGAFVKVAATDAAIRSAATALAAAGGGTVLLPPQTITLLSPLPVLAGVRYIGTPPAQSQSVITPGSYLADGEFTFSGGTVLKGDGTFDAFAANTTPNATAPANFGATQIPGFAIIGVGLDTFANGINIGAQNNMGLVWSELDQIYIRNCSGWGVHMVNFLHVKIGHIEDVLCQNGQYYGANAATSAMIPGNSSITELFHLTPQDGRDRRLTRGIVFEGTTTGLNELHVGRIQSNCYNKALLTDTVTLTSGTQAVAVADGTKYFAGMPVTFTATLGGFTASLVYIVQSVSGNTLVLGTNRTGAAITPSASGTLTLKTYGFPNVEITAADATGQVLNGRFDQIDIEGFATVALYMENAKALRVSVSELPSTSLVHLAGRNVGYSEIYSTQAAITDFDANSAGSAFAGVHSTTLQRPMRGLFYDQVNGVNALQISNGASGQQSGDIHVRNGGFLYPSAGMGERIFTRDSAITLGGNNAGDVVFAGSAAQTFTLPTIVTDTSTPGNSQVGLVFDIYNVGLGTITVNTDGTQLMNKVAGRTTTTVAPGNKLKLIGAKDNSGNLFWLATPTALLA